MLFRPSESSRKITDFYKRYLLTTFATNNEQYNNQLKEALEKEGAIADGPYISMSDPYEKGESLKTLAEEGVVSPEILKIKNFYPERPLYLHQAIAVKKAVNGKNLIVTTGTGSGKTESFLIPVINQLLREKENGTLGPGVRTLIIYPMNALVNDQIRRLRELLADMEGTPKITFGRFTSETEETYKAALRKYEEVEDISVNPLSENELISREQMRMNPPNILITNYAMLEYMLLRPGDNIIFGEDNASKWQYIVFDEAHSYGGAKGIEVSSLVRRVKAMLGRADINFILTSATLGDEKSDSEIIRFGESLCSAKFDVNSIVRSSTVNVKANHDIEHITFELYRKLAGLIRENASDAELRNCLKENDVNFDSESDISEILFELILHDEFYYRVREVLYNQIKPLGSIAYELGLNVEDFTDFIAVASNALRNGERLFEAKYHMFLRGMEGVFITLAPSNKLFIKKMETYQPKPFDDNDIGYKVFEVSFCSNCNALYITGQENEGYLVQKSKFNDDYNPDVFLLSGDFDEEDEEESENIFQVCSKCGAIKRLSSVNGLQCGHGNENINKLIRVKKSGEYLHSCPCCHSMNGQRSILRPYFLGSEAATAVIATALYNELPGEIHHVTKKMVEDPFFGDEILEKEETQIVEKQFLAFSDNRQTAAFFATYLESTYRDSMIKRIMHQIMEDNEEKFREGISVSYFINLLVSQFEKTKLFAGETEENIQKNAWIYTLKEISNYKAKNSLMKKGNLFFDVDFNIPQLKLPLSAEEVISLFKVMCRHFMRDASIMTPMDEVFTKADEAEYTVAGFVKGYDRTGAGVSYVIGWCPEEGKTNKRLKYLTKILDGDESTARKFLVSMWNYMEKHKYVQLASFGKRNAYKLSVDKIKVKSIHKLYICSECKGISPYSVKGICENPKCNGHLTEYYPDVALTDDHYYNLYTSLCMDPMSVKEHTAQLASDKAYEYQKQFKDKKINVLSCSTTFEMGVDVGSLETVFMRNMPPSPANYAQRAGRAGRSLKSAAYAITFCPNSSHDLNYFKNPVAMIKGTINPPFFNVSNDKIVLRHIFASAFSHFWKVYPELYKKTIGEFIDADGFDRLKDYLALYPEKLKEYLLRIVPEDLQDHFRIRSFGWVESLFCNDEENRGLCNIVVDKYKEDINDLEKAKGILVADNKKPGEVARIMRSINTIKDQQIIEFLSKNNLIPKYGFPVDTVELQSAKTGSNSALRLNRDLFSAISEYAPESEIVADGKLLKSRYVRKLSGYEWPKYNYAVCPDCLTLNRTGFIHAIKTCRQCGETLHGRGRQYIIPKFGFLLDNEGPKPVGLNKPERTYKGSISYIGDENQIEFHEYFVCGHRIVVGNSKMDSLAVLNEASFFICENCGYGTIDEKTTDRVIECKHDNPTGYPCINNRLIKYALGHEFQTDVALLKFVDFDISKQEEAWTILYSMLEGLSRYMCIDRNELSGCLTWYRDSANAVGNFGFVLFDNTPGGAGYVRQLKNPDILANMLQEGFRVVNNCTCGGEAADTACYSCLCNYYNQKQHDILKRKYALDFYIQFALHPDGEWEATRNEEVYVSSIICEKETVDSGLDIAVDNDDASREHYQLQFCNEGQSQMSETTKEIWENLLGDCDDDEYELIRQFLDYSEINISKPLYRESVVIIETGEKFFVDQIWKDKKVMLFLGDSQSDFEIAKKTGWHCYCTKESFEIKEFIRRIEV